MQLPDAIIGDSVGRGDIMHADIFEDIDHGKFFVVLSVVDKKVGYFYINSNINRYIQRRQQSLNMQFPMRPADYPFLSHLSFLDATEIGILKLDELTEYLKTGRCQRVGEMSAMDMEMLLHSAQESNLFTRKEKDTFLKL